MTEHTPNLFLSFVVLLVIACFTSYYANKKGRNPLAWFILALLLGIFAPLILFFLSDLKSEDQGVPSMTVTHPDSSHSSESRSLVDHLESNKEENKLWYYLDREHRQVGPVSTYALRELWNRGKLDLNQYVWSEGMEKWEKVTISPL